MHRLSLFGATLCETDCVTKLLYIFRNQLNLNRKNKYIDPSPVRHLPQLCFF